jgi:hypothetical protein
MEKPETKEHLDPHAGHAHAAEGGYDRGEPNTPIIGFIGGAIVLIVIIVILGIQFVYQRSLQDQVAQKQELPVASDLLELRAKEDAALYQYRYIDRAAGTVGLPIERAMDLLVKEAAEGRLKYPTKPAPVKKVDPLAPETPGAPQGTTNATPAASKAD